MMNTCLAPTSGGSGIGCDNMSVCIVALLHEKESLDQWYARLSNKISDEDLKKLPTADELSNDLYKVDLETKLSDTKDEDSINGKIGGLRSTTKDVHDDHDEDEDDDDVLKGGAPAFLQQLLAASSASRNNNVIYLDPSATSILQSLGVMEEDGEVNSENNDADDDAKIKDISEETTEENGAEAN